MGLFDSVLPRGDGTLAFLLQSSTRSSLVLLTTLIPSFLASPQVQQIPRIEEHASLRIFHPVCKPDGSHTILLDFTPFRTSMALTLKIW